MTVMKIEHKNMEQELNETAENIVKSDVGFQKILKHSPIENLRIFLMMKVVLSDFVKTVLANLKLQDRVIDCQMQMISDRLQDLNNNIELKSQGVM